MSQLEKLVEPVTIPELEAAVDTEEEQEESESSLETAEELGDNNL